MMQVGMYVEGVWTRTECSTDFEVQQFDMKKRSQATCNLLHLRRLPTLATLPQAPVAPVSVHNKWGSTARQPSDVKRKGSKSHLEQGGERGLEKGPGLLAVEPPIRGRLKGGCSRLCCWRRSGAAALLRCTHFWLRCPASCNIEMKTLNGRWRGSVRIRSSGFDSHEDAEEY